MSGGSKAWTILLWILLGVLMSGLAAFCVYHFIFADIKPSHGESSELEYQGRKLEDGEEIGQIESGAEFILFSGEECVIRIEAYEAQANDFAFNIGGREYQWQNFAGEDLTEGFSLERNGSKENETFRIDFEGFEGIMQKIIGTEEQVAVPMGENAPQEVRFSLIVSPEEGESLSVVFSVPITQTIILDPPYIIF